MIIRLSVLAFFFLSFSSVQNDLKKPELIPNIKKINCLILTNGAISNHRHLEFKYDKNKNWIEKKSLRMIDSLQPPFGI